MNFGFVTCVKLGYSCIKKIYAIGEKLDLIITLDDNLATKKSGRIYLEKFCNNNNIDLLKISHINDPIVIEKITSLNIDWLFIIGWSQIASEKVVNSPNLGCIGAHPTLLPQGRGRASIPWAIIKKLEYTGLTFFKIDEGVDTGDILYQSRIDIDKDETATTLYEKINNEHINIIEKIWDDLKLNRLKTYKQNNRLATYWEGRKPRDGELFEEMNVKYVDRLVRATTHPYPGAYIYMNKNTKLIIWKGRILKNNIRSSKFIFKFSDGCYQATEFEEVNSNI